MGGNAMCSGVDGGRSLSGNDSPLNEQEQGVCVSELTIGPGIWADSAPLSTSASATIRDAVAEEMPVPGHARLLVAGTSRERRCIILTKLYCTNEALTSLCWGRNGTYPPLAWMWTQIYARLARRIR